MSILSAELGLMDVADELADSKPKSKRSTFLTVLCILSFIGIGYGIISSAISYFTFDTIMESFEMGMDQMEQAEEEANSAFLSGMLEMAEASMEHGKTLNLVTFIANLICLIGVLRMWKLRRNGFYIYAVGELAPGIVTGLLLGWIAGILGLILAVVMVALYAVNLKEMN